MWPDLSTAPKAVGGGEKDSAVIVGIENYLLVAKIPGARRNAQNWQAYLTETRKVGNYLFWVYCLEAACRCRQPFFGERNDFVTPVLLGPK